MPKKTKVKSLVADLSLIPEFISTDVKKLVNRQEIVIDENEADICPECGTVLSPRKGPPKIKHYKSIMDILPKVKYGKGMFEKELRKFRRRRKK